MWIILVLVCIYFLYYIREKQKREEKLTDDLNCTIHLALKYAPHFCIDDYLNELSSASDVGKNKLYKTLITTNHFYKFCHAKYGIIPAYDTPLGLQKFINENKKEIEKEIEELAN